MKKFLNSDWLRVVQFFRNTVPKNEIQSKKINTVQISLTMYLGFLIGLKYEKITKIANKIPQQFQHSNE
jgi:hypothetical protein